MSDIRNHALALQRWNWKGDGYEQAFPRGIGIGDIDGCVELNYCWLFIENKHWTPNTTGIPPLPVGQHLCLTRLVRAHSRFRCFVLYGDASMNRPYYLRSWRHERRELAETVYDWRDATVDAARDELRSLYDSFTTWAEAQTTPVQQ